MNISNPEKISALLLKNRMINEELALFNSFAIDQITATQHQALKNLLKQPLSVNDEEGQPLFTIPILELLKIIEEAFKETGIKFKGFELIGGAVAKVLQSDTHYFEKMIGKLDADAGKISLHFPSYDIPDIDIRIELEGSNFKSRELLRDKLIEVFATLAEKQNPAYVAHKIAILFGEKIFVPEPEKFEQRIQAHWKDPQQGILQDFEAEKCKELAQKFFRNTLFSKLRNQTFLILGFPGLDLVFHDEPLPRDHLISLDAARLPLKNGSIVPGPPTLQTAQGLSDLVLEVARIDQPQAVNEYDFYKLMSALGKGKDLAVPTDEALAVAKFMVAFQTPQGHEDFFKYLKNHFGKDASGLLSFLWHVFCALKTHLGSTEVHLFRKDIQPQLKEIADLSPLFKILFQCLVDENLLFEETLLSLHAIYDLLQDPKNSLKNSFHFVIRKDLLSPRLKIYYQTKDNSAPTVIQFPYPSREIRETCRVRPIHFRECLQIFLENPVDELHELWLSTRASRTQKQTLISKVFESGDCSSGSCWLRRWFNFDLVEDKDFILRWVEFLIENASSEIRVVTHLSLAYSLIQELTTLSHSEREEWLFRLMHRNSLLLGNTKAICGVTPLVKGLEALFSAWKQTPSQMSRESIEKSLASLQVLLNSAQPLNGFKHSLKDILPTIVSFLIRQQAHETLFKLHARCEQLQIPFPTDFETVKGFWEACLNSKNPEHAKHFQKLIHDLPTYFATWSEGESEVFIKERLAELSNLLSNPSQRELAREFYKLFQDRGETGSVLFNAFRNQLNLSSQEALGWLHDPLFLPVLVDHFKQLTQAEWIKLWQSLSGNTDQELLKTTWRSWRKAWQGLDPFLAAFAEALQCMKPLHSTIAAELLEHREILCTAASADERVGLQFLTNLAQACLNVENPSEAQLTSLEMLLDRADPQVFSKELNEKWISLTLIRGKSFLTAALKRMHKLVAHQTLPPQAFSPHLATVLLCKLVSDPDRETLNERLDLFETLKGNAIFKTELPELIMTWGKSSNPLLREKAHALLRENFERLIPFTSKSTKTLLLEFIEDDVTKVYALLNKPSLSDWLSSEDLKSCHLAWFKKEWIQALQAPKTEKAIHVLFERAKTTNPALLNHPEIQNVMIERLLDLFEKTLIDDATAFFKYYESTLCTIFIPSLEALIYIEDSFYQKASKISDKFILFPRYRQKGGHEDFFPKELHELFNFKIRLMTRLLEICPKVRMEVRLHILDYLWVYFKHILPRLETSDLKSHHGKLIDLFKQFIYAVPPVAYPFDLHMEGLRTLVKEHSVFKLGSKNQRLICECLFYTGQSWKGDNLSLDEKGLIFQEIFDKLTSSEASLHKKIHAAGILINAVKNVLYHDFNKLLDNLKKVVNVIAENPFFGLLERPLLNFFVILYNPEIINRINFKAASKSKKMEFFQTILEATKRMALLHPEKKYLGAPLLFVCLDWLRQLRTQIFASYNSDYLEELTKLFPLIIQTMIQHGESASRLEDYTCDLLISENLVKSDADQLIRAKTLNEYFKELVKSENKNLKNYGVQRLCHFITRGYYQKAEQCQKKALDILDLKIVDDCLLPKDAAPSPPIN